MSPIDREILHWEVGGLLLRYSGGGGSIDYALECSVPVTAVMVGAIDAMIARKRQIAEKAVKPLNVVVQPSGVAITCVNGD